MTAPMTANAMAWRVALTLASAATGVSATAQEFSYSGFGTLGAAVSDKDYTYQRFISDNGTVRRDSVLGAQFDVRFSAQWSATLQAKIAPAEDDDKKWETSAAWAFVSWRPSNEWLVRAGKVRLPLYLFSENLDVGQSYEFARMPTEMYSISPTTDIAGVYVTHNWVLGSGDLSLDVYSGSAPQVVQRTYARDTGTRFLSVNAQATGGVLTLRAEDSTWRLGVHHAETSINGDASQVPKTLTNITPGGGYNFLIPTAFVQKFSNDIVTMGFDVNLPGAWRVIGEFERNFQHDVALGSDTAGGYLSVLHKMDRVTPYVTIARLKTLGATARNWRDLSKAVPPPGAEASQRMLADYAFYYDQSSLSLGASYALTPQSKLKGEWMHSWIGKGSSMVDSPAGGGPVAHDTINVLSLSYNFVF
jgi:hypothetical protein